MLAKFDYTFFILAYNEKLNFFREKITKFLAGIVAEWSRALAWSHSEGTVPSSNPGEGCYGDGELSVTHIDGYNASDKYDFNQA